MSAPIPIILCGKATQVGQGVIMALRPEYEVIQFIQSPARAITEIPPILKGEPPPLRTDAAADESNIGSRNYAQAPQVILLGGGFTDEDVSSMRAAAARDVMGGGVPWIRPDMTKETPPFETKEYGMALVERAKATLKELQTKGEWGSDGVYWY